MVRKDVVDAAGVEIEALAEVADAHRRTLDVPAGVTLAPGRGPGEGRASRLGALPECEVGRVALGRIDLRTHALLERFLHVAGETSVSGEALHRVVHVAVDHVREAARDEPLDEHDHLGDMRGRARIDGRWEDAEIALVGEELRLVGRGDLHRRLARGERRGDDLVLPAIHRVLPHVSDIGDVLHLRDAPTVHLERAAQPVGEEIRAQVADVHRAVDGRPARVHADLALLQGDERLDPARQRVEETEHTVSLRATVHHGRQRNGGRIH